jgi:Zn-dependent protease with chaperone function
MDLTSLYLRTFLGAKPFVSSELDSLAEKMGVSQLLSRDRRDRYFITTAKGVSAASLGKKIVFGRRYYERLAGDERLAVSAHEMAHLRDDDNERVRIVLSSLGLSLLSTLIAFVALDSVLLTECVFCVSFLSLISIFTARDAEESKLREIRCDNVAVSFVGWEAMASSIRLAQSMLLAQKTEGRGYLWSGKRRKKTKSPDPTIEERMSAIIALGNKSI